GHRRRPRRQPARPATGRPGRRATRCGRPAGRPRRGGHGRQRAGRVLLVLPTAGRRRGADVPAAGAASRPPHRRPRPGQPPAGAPAARGRAGRPPRQARSVLAGLTRAHLLAEPAPGRFAFHDLLRAYAAERAQADEGDAERRAAVHRMLDHYLHTACPAALLIHPTSRTITPPPLQPGVEPQRLADIGQAQTWFEAERQVLMAAAAQALEEGFHAHAWQIAWALGRFLDLLGHWDDWVAAEQISLTAAERLGDRAAQAFAHWQFGYARARLGDHEDARAHLEQ